MKRGPDGDMPGTWCFPGGHIEQNETPEQAAVREAIEEIGHLPKGDRAVWTHSIKAYQPSVTARPQDGAEIEFTTFIQKVPEQFEPIINGESVGFAWAPLSDPPEPLHPGCRIALARQGMDELGVARAMVAGELSSPQRYQNMTLFNMRITGTGVAYRQAIDEFVYRRPEHYLNDEFLARCNGLSVIMMHPAKAILDSKEFNGRIVGTMLLPYIKGNEVWGIAKIYDDDALSILLTQPMSTSPAVLLNTSSDSLKTTMDDGSTLLIEGKPTLLDHLAICARGVWDKGGEPTGVDSHLTRGDSQMDEEAKKAADVEAKIKADADKAEKKAKADADEKAKMDADVGTKLDKMLSCVDSLTKRMDAWDEAETKKKADAEEAEKKAKADAEEEERKKGDPERLAADKAKKDAEEKEIKEKADAAKADAAKALADSVANAAKIADMEKRMPMALTDADHRAMTDSQAKADAVFQAHGMHAPRFMNGETPQAYRVRLADALKVHSKTWKGFDLAKIADSEATFEAAETQIYADSLHAAMNPTDLTPGSLRMIEKQSGGHIFHEFVGEPRSWMDEFAGPVRQHVTSINTGSKH